MAKLMSFPAQAHDARRAPTDVKVRHPLDLRHYLPYRVFNLTLNFAYRGKVRAAGDVAVGMRDWRILSFLASRGPHTNREVADAMGMDSATISRAVQLLKAQGLIDVRRSKRDRRMQLVILTQKGADAHDALAVDRKQFADEVESCLTEEERAQLYRALDKIDSFFSARRIEHDEWE
jgi:DNA-binding MarR family transcriptional regulator